MAEDQNYTLDNILKEFSAEPSAENEPEMKHHPPENPRGTDKGESVREYRRESTSRTKTERNSGTKAKTSEPLNRAPSRGHGNSAPAEKRGKHVPAFPAAVLAVLAVIIAMGIIVTNSKKIYPNIVADGFPVGGMTVDEANEVLNAAGWKERASALEVRTYAGITEEISPVNAGVILDASSVAETAYRYGRSGNIFSNLKHYISRLRGENVDINKISCTFNSSYISGKVAELESKVRDAFGDESYFADTESGELVCVKSNGILDLDSADLSEKITAALQSGSKTLEYAIEAGKPVMPDFQRIYDSVSTEPQNARFSDDGSRTIIPEKPGYRFNIAEAEKLWEIAQPGESVKIPLETLPAEVTAEYLESLMFHDLLGAVTTKYNNSNENRSSNVRLASSKIDGVVLYPGEEFSFNAIVGERTEEAGFLMAPAYAGYGDIKDELGGGVCQVSTGVYAAALFSFLKISSHTCHIYPPNYIQLGTDATVSIPETGRTIDLKIVNSKACPVKIVSYCTETTDEKSGKPRKSVTVEIWGTLETDDYMPVEFDNSYIDIYDYDRVIEPAYPDREGYKIKFTHEENEFEDDYGKGLRTATHRKVYDSKGNLVEDRIINPTYSEGYALDTYYYRG